MKNKSIVSLFIILVALVHCAKAQFVFGDTQSEQNDSLIQAKRLSFKIRNSNFFVDNEYKGEKTFGYTLPGFRLTPTLFYEIGDKISIEGGASMLNYHGANKYPCVIYSNLPTWLSYQYLEGIHIVPFFKINWNITRDWQLTLGNVDNENSHLLPEPLYNVEHTFSSDPECGVQMRLNKPYHKMDLWLNWFSFVFAHDIHQEAFTLGYNSQTNIDIKKDKFRFVVPISFLAQHIGGENLSGSFSVQSWVNFAAGLKGEMKIGGVKTAVGFDYLYYKQLTSGNFMPFEQGKAYYPYMELVYKDLKIKFAYYDSEDFVSLLGSPHFCNYSTNTPDLVFDRANQYYIRATYRYKIIKGCDFYAYFQMFKQNRITGDRPGFSKVERDGFVSFSFGVLLNLNHSILLKQFKH
jgi:hypothetical protein